MALHLPDPRESLVFFIDELHGFATTHFQNEERLQLKHKFPFRDKHAKGHHHLTDSLNQIRAEVHRIVKKTALSATDIDELHNHTTYLANDWLLAHLIKEDLKMTGFMDEE